MRNKRILNRDIMTSAKFLKMALSTQALYIHLCINADDDGIVEAFSVMRMIGAAEDELRVLQAKSFIEILNDDLVTYINDWNQHDNIRADRLIPSQYRDLLVKIKPQIEFKKPKKRADYKASPDLRTDNGQTMDGPRTDNGQTMDGPRTDNGQDMDRTKEKEKEKEKIKEINKEKSSSVSSLLNFPFSSFSSFDDLFLKDLFNQFSDGSDWNRSKELWDGYLFETQKLIARSVPVYLKYKKKSKTYLHSFQNYISFRDPVWRKYLPEKELRREKELTEKFDRYIKGNRNYKADFESFVRLPMNANDVSYLRRKMGSTVEDLPPKVLTYFLDYAEP